MNIFLSRLQILYKIRIKARNFRSLLTKSDNDNNEEHKRCIYKEDRYVQMLVIVVNEKNLCYNRDKNIKDTGPRRHSTRVFYKQIL